MSNSQTKAVALSKFDESLLTFSELKTGGKGGKFGNIQYNGGKCQFKVPKSTTFGADEYTSEDGTKQWTIQVQIKKEDIESDPEIKNTMEGFKRFEKALRENAKVNGQEYFGNKLKKKQQVSDEFLDASMNPIYKTSVNKETGEEDDRYHTFKVKLQPDRKKEGRFSFGAFDSKKEPLELTTENVVDKLQKWGKAKFIIEPRIYIINGKLGVSWYAYQLLWYEPEGGGPVNPHTRCMIDSSDDEEEEDNAEDKNELIDDSDSD